MGILHKNRKISENSLGCMYECLFPEYIVRFTIYNNSVNRIECWFWENNGYNERKGNGQCLRSFLNGSRTKKTFKESLKPSTKIGKGYDTFEEMDEDWTNHYNSLKK